MVAARLYNGLLPDNALPLNGRFLAVGIDNEPLSAEKLYGLIRVVFDGDKVRKHIISVVRIICTELCFYGNAYTRCDFCNQFFTNSKIKIGAI